MPPTVAPPSTEMTSSYADVWDWYVKDDAARSPQDAPWPAAQHIRSIELPPQIDRLFIQASTEKAEYLGQLGYQLVQSYSSSNELDDLEKGISALQNAINLTPYGHSEESAWLNNLASALRDRYTRCGKLSDLETATDILRREIELTPDGSPFKPAMLTGLGNALQSRYERFGSLDDLSGSISAHCSALALTSEGDIILPSVLANLGTSWRFRSLRLGDLDDLESAISAHRQANAFASDDHPVKPTLLINLGNALRNRFERIGKIEDIDNAVSVLHRVVRLLPDHHPTKAVVLCNIGLALMRRFRRLREHHDLVHSVLVHRQAACMTADNHLAKPLYLNYLGETLRLQFEYARDPNSLNDAISALNRAVELVPEAHTEKPEMLWNLGHALVRRFDYLQDMTDLERAISTIRLGLALMPADNSAARGGMMTSLGSCLLSQAKHSGGRDELDEAISVLQRGVDYIPKDSMNKGISFHGLGVALKYRFGLVKSHENFAAALACFVTATQNASEQSPQGRLDSAKACVVLLHENPEFSSSRLLLQAYGRLLAIFPEVIWLGHDVNRRYAESSALGKYVNWAVATAIDSSDLSQAAEWLEHGRAVVWSQILLLRTPLDELSLHHPNLAKAFGGVLEQLRCSVHKARSTQTHANDVTVDDIMDDVTGRHRALTLQYEHTLSKIRLCSGFEDFLQPKKICAFLAATQLLDGPVVLLNVHVSRCDALVLSRNNVQLVSLPELTAKRANDLRARWTSILEGYSVRGRGVLPLLKTRDNSNQSSYLLGGLWIWIVSPILRALDLINDTYIGKLPHLTWCPTGPLTQLPLHAAGLYNTAQRPPGPRTFDYIVSSYTPSLSALMRCREALEGLTTPSMLAVTQSHAPGLPPLPGVTVEAALLQDVLSDATIPSTVINNERATVASIRAVINQYPWVHLACHGSQHLADPTRSAFALYDGPLSLSDLMSTVASNAELAFLSACQTATGDEKAPEESAHLAAGMLAVGFKGVVATLWSIGDEEAPIVVQAYYKRLLELRRGGIDSRGGTGAAYALHDAVKVLREKVGEGNFVKWAPFVHFGV